MGEITIELVFTLNNLISFSNTLRLMLTLILFAEDECTG